MAIIGTFTKSTDGFEGTLEMITCPPSPMRILAVASKPNDQAPDYRVHRGDSEVGAAWTKRGKNGRTYLIVTLDDPAFEKPIQCRLVKSDTKHVLIWSR